MKIVALFPVKNEAWILKTTLPQIAKFADKIICADGGSTDGTIELLQSHEAIVLPQDEKNTNFSSWRKQLLQEGRKVGGTHFLWIDADECPTTNFLAHYKDELGKMKPGQKISMQWLCLWKSPYVYRDDKSVWSNLYKDFIFCDDGISDFDNTALHEGRTPGPNTQENTVQLPIENGAILHFQFVPFNRFQMKQAYQRCRELYMKTSSPRRINHKYSMSLDDDTAKTKKIPDEWVSGITNIEDTKNDDDSYYFSLIQKYFDEKGVKYFEPLQIWHIDKLRNLFINKFGREPKHKLYPKLIVKLNKIYKSIKNG